MLQPRGSTTWLRTLRTVKPLLRKRHARVQWRRFFLTDGCATLSEVLAPRGPCDQRNQYLSRHPRPASCASVCLLFRHATISAAQNQSSLPRTIIPTIPMPRAQSRREQAISALRKGPACLAIARAADCYAKRARTTGCARGACGERHASGKPSVSSINQSVECINQRTGWGNIASAAAAAAAAALSSHRLRLTARRCPMSSRGAVLQDAMLIVLHGCE